MRALFFILLAFSCSALFAETLPVTQVLEETVRFQLPVDETGKWRVDSRQMNSNGRAYTVWLKKNENQDEERIVVVSTPYKTAMPTIDRAISSAILPIKIQVGSNWSLLQKTEREAFLQWTVKKNKSALCKLILGDDALHTISYTYNGRNAPKVDRNKWMTFLKYSNLTSTGLPKTEFLSEECE